jgi:hypothetical protein
MAINDDFNSKAEQEMKMHDAKMMEQAKLKKLATASLKERIQYALSKKNNVAEDALDYMNENHLVLSGEKITADSIREYII